MNLLQVKLNPGYFKCNFHVITLDLEYHVSDVVKIEFISCISLHIIPQTLHVTITHGNGGKHAVSFRGKYPFG